MIYVIGNSQDVQEIMKERPLVDLAKIKLIQKANDLCGYVILPTDEVIWRNRPSFDAWEREEIRREIEVRQDVGRYQAQKEHNDA